MSKLIDIPIAKIKPHPHNVRRDAVADTELINSVKEQGILQPIGVVPDGKTFLLIAGHRRLAAAKDAKLKEIPAIVHEHLTTEAQQIEAMLVENGRRVDLTAAEEAEGYEQLELLGIKPAEIAQMTGRTKATVTARLKIAKLGTPAKDAIHTGQITLDQAEQLGKLDDATQAKVVETIGSNNFRWKLEEAVREIEKAERFAKRRADYEARGLVKIEKPEDGWNYQTGPRPLQTWNETDDAADAWTEDPYSGPVLLVQTVTPAVESDEQAAERAKRDAEWEAERAERTKFADAKAAAKTARVRHVVEQAAAIKIPKHLAPLIGLAVGQQLTDPAELLGTNLEDFNAAAGTDIQRTVTNDWAYDPTIATTVAAVPPAKLPAILAATLAFSAERVLWNVLDGDGGIDDSKLAVAYYDWVEATGYQLPDVDLADRDQIITAINGADDTEEGAA